MPCARRTPVESMSNKVYLGADGYIHWDFMGDQDYEAIKQSEVEMSKIAKELHKANKLAYVLGDFAKIGKQDSGARRAGMEFMNSPIFDKCGGFGAPLYIKYVGNLVIKATNKTNKLKIFNTRDEAERWLKS